MRTLKRQTSITPCRETSTATLPLIPPMALQVSRITIKIRERTRVQRRLPIPTILHNRMCRKSREIILNPQVHIV